MTEQELKQQLQGLFIGLEDSSKNNITSLLAPNSDSEAEQILYQLVGLFSDSEAILPAIAETELQEKAGPNRKTLPASMEDDVVSLLKSRQANERRRAVQNLAQVQTEWVIDPLLYAVTDADQEVARLALDSLVKMSQIVNRRVLMLTQQQATPFYPGSTAYLSHLLGQPVVNIPAGPFLMGSNPAVDGTAEENEQPQHQVTLSGYWIGRYPVTVSQFKVFLAESGYRLRHGNPAQGQQGDYPVVDVTWQDAVAYCSWLGRRSGLPVTLPSEAEWEKAARGTDGRRYPWGNDPPTAALCNFIDLTPVGSYSPQGDSPYGCADMAGNVWEWTRSAYKAYPYDLQDGREDLELEDENVRVVRGLTFNNSEKFTRCASRYRLKPILHLQTLGFRIAVSAAQPQSG